MQCPTVAQMPDARMFSNVQYKHGQTDKSQHHHHPSIKQNLPSPPAPRLPTELTAIPTAHATHSRHVHAHPPPISRSPKLVITNIGRRPEVLSTLVRGGNQGGKRDTTLGPYSTENVREDSCFLCFEERQVSAESEARTVGTSGHLRRS